MMRDNLPPGCTPRDVDQRYWTDGECPECGETRAKHFDGHECLSCGYDLAKERADLQEAMEAQYDDR